MEQVSCVLGLMLLTIAATAGEAPPTPVHRHTLRQPTPTPSSGCWDGWTENPDTGECYLLVKELMDVDDAHAYCASLAQNDNTPEIISLSTSQEHVFVYEWVKGQVVDGDRLWLGMKNMADNYWLDGTPVGYFNFAPGEPDSYQDGNYCIMMSMASGLWEDAICLVASAFICEMKGTNYVGPIVLPPPAGCPSGWQYRDGYCYYLSNTYLNHDDATKWCAANLATHLTSISNDDENNFILEEALKGGREVWLGLQVDEGGGWSWADHSTLNFTNWYGGHPSSADCVKMVSNNTDAEGTWEGEDCQQNLRYICKMLLKTCPQDWTYHERKCYYANPKKMIWWDSHNACKVNSSDADATLVSVHSMEENTFVGDMLGTINSNVTGPWLGLSFDTAMGNWTWADNTVLDFLMWDTNSPYPVEDKSCVKMVNDTAIDYHLRWTNLPCETLSPSICQLYPTHLMGCEDGWLESSGWCYWYSRTESTMANFLDAMWDCQVRGSDLVSINTQEENDFVGSIINNYNYADVWVGLTDNRHDAEMIWTDGAPVTFTNWKALNYADVKYHPMCGYHYKFGTNNEWGLGTCDPRQYYVCKKPFTAIPITPPDTGCRYGDAAYSGSCYTFPTYTHSWDNANRLCKTMNATLAVVNDRAEGAFLSMYLSELGATSWLGLRGTRNSDNATTFTWITQDPVTYTQWAVDQPNPQYGAECVSAAGNATPGGMWTVRSCTHRPQFVCEYKRTGHTPTPAPTTQPPQGGCGYNWTLHNNRCYKVFSEDSSWGDAELVCASYGGHLASVADAHEEATILGLQDLVNLPPFESIIWVGLYSDGRTGYEWNDRTPFAYVDWEAGQPDSYYGRENCGSASRKTLKLMDSVCSSLMPFVCEAQPGTMVSTLPPPTTVPSVPCEDDPSWLLYDDHCYKIVSGADLHTWGDSHLQCRKDGGELLSVHTLEENAWIESKISSMSSTSFWTGGQALMDSGFGWVDGTPFDFDNWAKGEPNNDMGAEDCVAMYNHRQGYWGDENCGKLMGRVCKRPHGSTLAPQHTTPQPYGRCRMGWVADGSNCLKFFPEEKSFDAARAACQLEGEGADLASIHTPEEQAYVTAAVGELEANVWLGLRGADDLHWVDQTPVTYTNWYPGEPSGQPGKMRCVEAYAMNGQWNDDLCDGFKGYVCKIKKDDSDSDTVKPCSPPYQNYMNYTGACYRSELTRKTWHDAEAACVSEGSHLASVKQVRQGAMVWVLSYNQGARDPWIGLNNINNHHQFTWSDGWPTTYTNWARGQPNASLADHNCVRLDSSNGLWYSENCDQVRPFICIHEEGPPPTPEPPVNGHCPTHDWLDLGGAYCYLAVTDQETWVDASVNCSDQQGGLVSIHSQAEASLLSTVTSNIKDSFWTGLVLSTSGYVWTDGTGLDYINWDDGQPGNDSQNCVEMLTRKGTWVDVDCTTTRAFVCKTEKIPDVHPTPPPTSQPGLSTGGVVGIVLAVVVVVAGFAFLGFYAYTRRTR
ncbi:macrophage mannose receptor 1-like isoform X2 [Homarus americanus]|nr:macrophage mannose receptor 1-like isoform X2 [Homarus americanus]